MRSAPHGALHSLWSRALSSLPLFGFHAFLAAAFLTAALLLAGGPIESSKTLQPASDELLAEGRTIYASLCQRCHGPDGSDVSYPGIVPLEGIGRRLSESEIASLSAPFVGRTFEGREARALSLYLDSLKGAKGFAEPGFLFSPHLLNAKRAHTGRYRILDVRLEADFEAGRIPEAIHWNGFSQEGKCLAPPQAASRAVAELGVCDEAFVVIVDERGGPAAACLWWSLQRDGRSKVAVLDGGWNAWKSQGFETDSSTSPRVRSGEAFATEGMLEPGPALALLPEGGETPVWLRWSDFILQDGIVPASEALSRLEAAGWKGAGRLRVSGPEADLGFLVFLLHLLGDRASYDEEQSVLTVFANQPSDGGGTVRRTDDGSRLDKRHCASGNANTSGALRAYDGKREVSG